VLSKPRNSLDESLLLRESLSRHSRIAPDRKPVLHPREQVDLERLLCSPQDLLGLVPLLGREDVVQLGCGDGQRARNARELVGLDERGVRDEAAVDAVLVVADDVLRATWSAFGQWS
jgi:hypothetical protein